MNLIAGENNSGKTALLESIFLHCGALNPTLVLSIASLRGIGTYKLEFGRAVDLPWGALFAGLDLSSEIRIVGIDRVGVEHSITLNAETASGSPSRVQEEQSSARGVAATTGGRGDVLKLTSVRLGVRRTALLQVSENEFTTEPPSLPLPPAPAKFLSARWMPDFKEMAEQFGALELENRQDSLMSVLRLMEPRLARLSVIMLGGVPMLHADVGLRKLVPLAYLGDGILRLTKLILQIIHTAGGTLIVDEIDNGLHYSVLGHVWSAIAESTERFNVQLFATTHSRECIAAAHKAFSQTMDYDFVLQRLEKRPEGVISVDYDREALESALELGFEVR